MSQRGKRGNHQHHPRLDVEPQPPPSKRRKGRPPTSGNGIGGVGSASSSGLLNETAHLLNLGLHHTSTASNSSNVIVINDNETTPRANISSLQTHEDATISNSGSASTGKMGGASTSSAAAWQPRSVSDIKISSIYNRSSTEAPAELYR